MVKRKKNKSKSTTYSDRALHCKDYVRLFGEDVDVYDSDKFGKWLYSFDGEFFTVDEFDDGYMDECSGEEGIPKECYRIIIRGGDRYDWEAVIFHPAHQVRQK